MREGSQRKSSVERSGSEIAVKSLTEFRTDCFVPYNDLNEGAPKKKLRIVGAKRSRIYHFIVHLLGDPTAINRQGLPRNERSLVGTEPDYGIGNFVRLP